MENCKLNRTLTHPLNAYLKEFYIRARNKLVMGSSILQNNTTLRHDFCDNLLCYENLTISCPFRTGSKCLWNRQVTSLQPKKLAETQDGK